MSVEWYGCHICYEATNDHAPMGRCVNCDAVFCEECNIEMQEKYGIDEEWECAKHCDQCNPNSPFYQKKIKTPEEYLKFANQLAREFYSIMGYNVNEDYRFDKATHPQERMIWHMAMKTIELCFQTDMEDILIELEEEE